MKTRFLCIPVLLLGLVLGGCASNGTLTKLGEILTTTYSNPVTATNIYQVKNGYAAALQLVVDYRQYCWSKPYAAILTDPVAKPICENRRAVVRKAQSAKAQARKAITAAENFVLSNPTLNASTVIQAAWAAVKNFQNVVPRVQ